MDLCDLLRNRHLCRRSWRNDKDAHFSRIQIFCKHVEGSTTRKEARHNTKQKTTEPETGRAYGRLSESSNTAVTHIDALPAHNAVRERGSPRRAMTSKEIYHFEYDHHLISTSGAWFHENHINLCTRMLHVAVGKASEILFPWLAESGGQVNR